MTIQAGRLAALLKQINSGCAAEALPKLDTLLAQNPGHLPLLTLRAEALRQIGRASCRERVS